MGGSKKKKKVEEPTDIRQFRLLTKDISGAPPIDISAFQQAISSRIQNLTQQTVQQLQEIQRKRLEGLTHSLMSAIGSLQYNPYAEKIKTAISSLTQQKVEPLQQLQTNILSQYGRITPDISKTLRMAGAYKAVPAIRERIEKELLPFILKSEKDWYDATGGLLYGWIKQSVEAKKKYAQHISKYFAPAYETSMKFLADTSDMLKNLGLSEDEIKQALTPYYTAMSEGESMAFRYL